jgi:redox-sensitive bicupin YhaK (pirin superfamily)
VIQLHRQRISSSFSAIGLRPDMLPMGHVLNIDHFQMSMPTFPPHPHAGFSAVTFMLPWSPGGFINRDSLGDRSPILPGALHWTLAGAGMMHEEIPENPGETCEGLQIFVKLPENEELCPPQALHLGPSEIPRIYLPEAHIQVLVGTVAGVSSPMPNSGHTTMALVQVQGHCRVDIPPALAAFAMGIRGSGRVAGHPFAAHQAMSLPAGTVEIQGEGLDLLLAWSAAMPTAPTFRGPFCMFQADRLADSARRFRAGEMGTLAPSPGAWARG